MSLIPDAELEQLRTTAETMKGSTDDEVRAGAAYTLRFMGHIAALQQRLTRGLDDLPLRDALSDLVLASPDGPIRAAAIAVEDRVLERMRALDAELERTRDAVERLQQHISDLEKSLENARKERAEAVANNEALVRAVHNTCPACHGARRHAVRPPNGDGAMTTPCSHPVHGVDRAPHPGAALLERLTQLEETTGRAELEAAALGLALSALLQFPESQQVRETARDVCEDQHAGKTLQDRVKRLEETLQTIMSVGGVHGGAWCAGQALAVLHKGVAPPPLNGQADARRAGIEAARALVEEECMSYGKTALEAGDERTRTWADDRRKLLDLLCVRIEALKGH